MVHAETLQNVKYQLQWFLLACALLLGGAALVVATRPVPIPAAPAHPPAGVGGVAELAVITHLVRAVGVPGGQIPEAHTIGIDPAGPDQWAARVAIHDPAALRLWQVRVSTAQGTPQVVGLPALVPVPDLAPVAKPTFAPGGGDPALRQVVADTLAGLLTGSPDLGRYTSADATLTPINPPPFVSVELVGLTKPEQVGEDVLVLAEITGQRADGVTISAHYPLALTQTEGRWEVRGILRALPTGHQAPNPTQ